LRLTVDLGGEIGIATRKLGQGFEIFKLLRQTLPGVRSGTHLAQPAHRALGGDVIVPEAGFDAASLEIVDLALTPG